MKRCLILLLTLSLCFGLFGCKKKHNTDIDLVPQAGQMTYDFAELQFSLYFPDNWYDFFTVTQDAEKPVVSVTVDGEPSFAIASYEKNAELPALETALKAESFAYFTENAQKVFYLRIDRELPESLQYELTDSVAAANVGMTTTEYAIEKIFSYHDASAACSAKRSEWLESWLYPHEQDYVNYRLGFSLHFPEEWTDEYILIPEEDRVRVYVKDLLESGMYRESAYIFDIVAAPKDAEPIAAEEGVEQLVLGYNDTTTFTALLYERDYLAGAAYEFYYVELAQQLQNSMFEMLKS